MKEWFKESFSFVLSKKSLVPPVWFPFSKP